MNLIEKYIEVVKAVHGFRYNTEVIKHINETLGTEYRNTVLNNWASEISPRPVPAQVIAHMRETVLLHLFTELDVDVKSQTADRFIATVNSEPAMRRQLIADFIVELGGKTLSAAKLKALAQTLEPPAKE